MTDDETRWYRFLDGHPRIDKAHDWYLTHLRPRAIRWEIERRLEYRRWQPGTTFLEHGHTPAVMFELDEYDGYTAVSMVDGRTMGGSIFHCGPEIITPKEAMKRANEMRAEAEKEQGDGEKG